MLQSTLKSLLATYVFLILHPKESYLFNTPTHPLTHNTFGSRCNGFEYDDAEMKRLKIWPRGFIPYIIDDFSFDKVLRIRIRNALKNANSWTGLRITEVPRPPTDEDTRWVFFVNRRGLQNCADVDFRNFTTKGVQKVVLGYNCMSDGDLAEAILAIVGVPPQHNAPNRDEYVEVLRENILPEKLHLFEKYKDNEWLFHELPYDYHSAGHYNYHKYTKNGKATLKPLKEVKKPVGEPITLDFYDIFKISMLYNYVVDQDTADVTDCSKLFERGTNFSGYKPGQAEKINPRAKPNKFLGLPDETPNFSNEDVSKDVKNKEKVKNKRLKNSKSTIEATIKRKIYINMPKTNIEAFSDYHSDSMFSSDYS